MALSGSPVCFSMELILSEQVGGALSAAGTAPLGFTEGGGSITTSKPICESFVTKSAEKPRPKMLSWFQSLMPRDEGFFDLFERHAQTVVAGSRALRSLLEGGDGILGYSQEIKRHENEADLITRDVLLAVRRTFITPFDRGDIRDLITAMDDTIDQMHQTAKATLIYETRDFEPPMRRMGDIIIQAADLTVVAIPLLRSMGQNAGKLNSFGEEISRIEDEADAIHDQGLRDLFRAHRHSDQMAFIVGAEIYDHLEKVVDGFEDVAKRVTSIVIEHV